MHCLLSGVCRGCGDNITPSAVPAFLRISSNSDGQTLMYNYESRVVVSIIEKEVIVRYSQSSWWVHNTMGKLLYKELLGKTPLKVNCYQRPKELWRGGRRKERDCLSVCVYECS